MAIYVVGLKCMRRTRARARRVQVPRCARARSSCIILSCIVQSAERVAREDSLLEFPVPSSHASKDLKVSVPALHLCAAAT